MNDLIILFLELCIHTHQHLYWSITDTHIYTYWPNQDLKRLLSYHVCQIPTDPNQWDLNTHKQGKQPEKHTK